MGDAGSVFELLFKYPLELFGAGRIELAAPWGVYIGAVLAALVLVPTALGYGKAAGKAGFADRVLLTALRSGVLAVIAFSLFRPELVLPTGAPERGVLAVLLDDSRSMQIADSANGARGEQMRVAFDPASGTALAAISARFDVRLFRFGTRAEAIDSAAELSFGDGSTRLGAAITEVRESLSGQPLVALVAVTDGAHNADPSLTEALLGLNAAGVALHTVGVGMAAYERDIELAPIATPRSVLQGTAIAIDVDVAAHGYPGQRVPVIVEDGGRILNRTEIELGDGDTTRARLEFALDEPGARRLRFRVPAQPDETLSENNTRTVLVRVRDDKARILYFEGEPRFEVKFIRRALRDDENLELVTLIRTAANKFYRVGVDDAAELRDGFPSAREALFEYDGLILGSVEAAYFTREQLEMIADFASVRGGGVLFLGGRYALSEGGYAGTPVADALPVVIERAPPVRPAAKEVTLAPTVAGLRHPVLQIPVNGESLASRWQTLPPLTVVNPLRQAKPGAEIWLEAGNAGDDTPLVLLAAQRYGRGRSVAFPVQNIWRLQMHESVALDDQSHETLWRQLLRWLVQSVPQRITTEVAEHVAPGEPVDISAEVRSPVHELAGATPASVTITSPSGLARRLDLDADTFGDGARRARFVPDELGLYELRVEARDDDGKMIKSEAFVEVSDEAREFHDATLQTGLLERSAAQTGGTSRLLEDAASLEDAIAPGGQAATSVERLALWNMPIMFLLLVVLVSLEWIYRRRRGLA